MIIEWEKPSEQWSKHDWHEWSFENCSGGRNSSWEWKSKCNENIYLHERNWTGKFTFSSHIKSCYSTKITTCYNANFALGMIDTSNVSRFRFVVWKRNKNKNWEIYVLELYKTYTAMQKCPLRTLHAKASCKSVCSGHFCICNRARGYAKTVRWTCTWLYMCAHKRACMNWTYV